MPNWVYNTLTIQGPKDQIDYIKDKLNEPFTRTHDSWNMDKQEMELVEVSYDNPIFAFWNIIRPTDLEAYSKQGDMSTPLNERLLFQGNNWYDWNVRNWGTKWDVAVSNDEKWPDTELYEHKSEGEDNWLIYTFNTAWSPAEPAMINLSKLIPNCVLTLEYEEETGWGGESEFVNGKKTQDKFYDWCCRECGYEADETPYCEICEFDMCPSCGYGEPMDEDRAKCPTHGVELAQIGKEE